MAIRWMVASGKKLVHWLGPHEVDQFTTKIYLLRSVSPAKAGVQKLARLRRLLDSGFRRNDEYVIIGLALCSPSDVTTNFAETNQHMLTIIE